MAANNTDANHARDLANAVLPEREASVHHRLVELAQLGTSRSRGP